MTEQKQRPSTRQTPPWEREADNESVPFGSWLRQQRELREITLREISDATKISLRYLEALEEERFDLLPATLFARGFLRQYARYVGLDPDEAVNRLLIAQQDDEPEPEEERRQELPWAPARTARRGGGNWKNVVLIVGVAALLLGLIFLIPWLLDRSEADDRQQAVPPGVVPSDSAEDRDTPPPEPEPETSGAPLTVTLDFREDCWVEATVDGEPRVGEVRVQGESLQLEAEEYVELTLGNAGVVDVEVNGEPYPLNASPGSVRSFRLDAPRSAADEAREVPRRRASPSQSDAEAAPPAPPPAAVSEPSPEAGASEPPEQEPPPGA